MSDETKELLFKDLSMRLPYGVYVLDNDDQCELLSVGSCEVKTTLKRFPYSHKSALIYVKPILRPLSDLSDQHIFKMGYDPDQIKSCIEDVQRGLISHLHFMYLIENHYDVSLLIERGMAVDVNTIETDPYK